MIGALLQNSSTRQRTDAFRSLSTICNMLNPQNDFCIIKGILFMNCLR